MAATSASPSFNADRRGTSPSKIGSPAAIGRGDAHSRTSSAASISRARSIRTPGPGSKGGIKKIPGTDDDARAETAAAMEELKGHLKKAEEANEEYQKQLYVAKTQLDEARNEQNRMEEVTHSYIERLESLEKSYEDALKAQRDCQDQLDQEKIASEREKEQAHTREEELQTTVHKLRESLAIQREHRKSIDGEGLLSRSTSFRGRSSPRPSPDSPIVRRDSSQSNSSNLVLQKDKVIESLRLELAEAQIKLVEMENAGGGHVQDLEKMLLEARMSNAKLLEDNESYQVLLSEKTLNGDFAKSDFLGVHQGSSPRRSMSRNPSSNQNSHNLADELETAKSDDGASELSPSDDSEADRKIKRLQGELDGAKDQNKALTLYINKIISRLLANEQFEKLFAETTADEDPEPPIMGSPSKNSETTAPPSTATSVDGSQASAGQSLLARAGSIFGGRKTRPTNLSSTSSIPEKPADAIAQPMIENPNRRSFNPNENPETAPSIPMRRANSTRAPMRSHRRATSEWSANVVNNMYRGPPAGGSAAGPLSPSALSSGPRTSFFAGGHGPPPPLILEDNERKEIESDLGTIETNSTTTNASPKQTGGLETPSDSGYEGSSIAGTVSKAPSEFEPPGSPRSAASAALEGRTPQLAVPSSSTSDRGAGDRTSTSGMSGWFSSSSSAKPSQMRPLRLVQEKQEADEERKRQNRTSFMGWFGSAAAAPGSLPPGSAAGHNQRLSGVPSTPTIASRRISSTYEAGPPPQSSGSQD